VIGQAYQTGADAWQLFALWAALAVPWALAGRAPPHWWLVLAVGNLALLRYLSVRPGVEGLFAILFNERHMRLDTLILTLSALGQLAVWVLLARVAPALGFRGAGGPRLLVALICLYAVWAAMAALFGRAFDSAEFATAVAALALPGAWLRWQRFDIVGLSLVCLAAIVIAVAALGRVLVEASASYGGFLLVALGTVGLSAMAAHWLLRLQREHGEAA
jgi:uncharacterized membrane protein